MDKKPSDVSCGAAVSGSVLTQNHRSHSRTPPKPVVALSQLLYGLSTPSWRTSIRSLRLGYRSSLHIDWLAISIRKRSSASRAPTHGCGMPSWTKRTDMSSSRPFCIAAKRRLRRCWAHECNEFSSTYCMLLSNRNFNQTSSIYRTAPVCGVVASSLCTIRPTMSATWLGYLEPADVASIPRMSVDEVAAASPGELQLVDVRRSDLSPCSPTAIEQGAWLIGSYK